MNISDKTLTIVGGGLAGCEAAWQAALLGVSVRLHEMRPMVPTGAHVTSDLAELVCSNSLGSNLFHKASGLLKQELRILNSLLISCADRSCVPAGSALAVDRLQFSRLITQALLDHPNITIIREEVSDIPAGPAIIASGPLTSAKLSDKLAELLGQEHLFFFDAISPIVHYDSIDFTHAYKGSRYRFDELGEGDYVNCPLTRSEYDEFVAALISAERIELKDFEQQINVGVNAGAKGFFEGCLPVEVLACRSHQALAFGPLRPVGLHDPRTRKGSYATAQLRQDDLAGSLYNLVGFQTNLTFAEQQRVFRMIPGLHNAVFERFGKMHRNTFIYSPGFLLPTLQFDRRQDLFFAGQITGVEGYAGNIATGWLAGVNAARLLCGSDILELPATTMTGALCRYITHAAEKDFQPMKANFNLMPPLDESMQPDKIDRKARAKAYAERALSHLSDYLSIINCV